MNTDLTLYECQDIINDIEAIAAQNDGEIPEDQLALLVQAQTQSLTKLGGLCGFISYVQSRIGLCKQEEKRIAAMRKTAEKRLASVKQFLLPFVSWHRREKGRALEVGTFRLSTRKSEEVEIDDLHFGTEENHKQWCTERVTYIPDKDQIKAALKAGVEIAGARIKENESLQIR